MSDYLKELKAEDERRERKEVMNLLTAEYRKYLRKYTLEDLKELECGDRFTFGERR